LVAPLPADAAEVVTVFRSPKLDATAPHARVSDAKRFHAALVPLHQLLGAASESLSASSTTSLRVSELPDVALRLGLLARVHGHVHEMLRPLGHVDTSVRELLDNPAVHLAPLVDAGGGGAFGYGVRDGDGKVGADDVVAGDLLVAVEGFLVSSSVK